MRTKAIVFAAKESVRIQDLDVAAPGKHEIQVRSTYSTISSGTESWMLRDQFTRVQIPWPFVPGYQRSGVVTAVGADAGGWKVGDRALALISSWIQPEVTSALGGHIGLGNVSLDHAYRLAENVDDADASCAVVAQVGYNAATRVHLKPGDWVVVWGDGLVGQCAAQAARARGARVILVGHRPDRLAIAKNYCADVALDGANDNIVSSVRKAADSETVTAVLDTIQSMESQKQYMPLLAVSRGQIVYAGFAPGHHWADMAMLQESELSTHFVNGFTRERMDATLKLIAERAIRISPLITHRVAYPRGPEMYQMILQKDKSFLGIALDWRDSG